MYLAICNWICKNLATIYTKETPMNILSMNIYKIFIGNCVYVRNTFNYRNNCKNTFFETM